MKKGVSPKGPVKAIVQYEPEIAEEICRRMALGESLVAICETTEGFPVPRTVERWVSLDVNGFAADYQAAREVCAERLAREIIELSDRVRIGERIKKADRKKIFNCSTCEAEVRWSARRGRESGYYHVIGDSVICEGGQPVSKQLYAIETITGDMVERSKLQIEARKWYASRLFPRRYGDKVEVEHTGALGASIAEAIRAARAKRTGVELEGQVLQVEGQTA